MSREAKKQYARAYLGLRHHYMELYQYTDGRSKILKCCSIAISKSPNALTIQKLKLLHTPKNIVNSGICTARIGEDSWHSVTFTYYSWYKQVMKILRCVIKSIDNTLLLDKNTTSYLWTKCPLSFNKGPRLERFPIDFVLWFWATMKKYIPTILYSVK